MKIKPSDKCQYCDKIDYIEHFFFQCKSIRHIWKEIEKYMLTNLNLKLNIEVIHVLYGVVELPQKVSKGILHKVNTILAIGKLVISKFKYGNKRNLMELYESEMHLRQMLK